MVMYYNNAATQTEKKTVLPTFTSKDMRQINELIHNALLSQKLQKRLMSADADIQREFNLPNHVWEKLSRIKVSTMSDYCGELMRIQNEIS